MNAIYDSIKAAVGKELRTANEKHPLFASLHEAYGVIYEECCEACEELADVDRFFSLAWQQIRKDNSKLALEHISRVRDAAVRLAIEACQVAAMCDKAAMSERKKDVPDWDGSGD